MAKNAIQFQPGLSLPDFLSRCGPESQCRGALFARRWPKGFIFPRCGNTTYCELNQKPVYQCHSCHHQSSLTAGTLFADAARQGVRSEGA